MSPTKKIFFAVLLAALIIFSFGGSYASAAVSNACVRFWPIGYWGGSSCPLIPCSGSVYSGAEKCQNLCDFIAFIQRVIYFGMSLGVFVLAPIFLGWGAVMIMIARGSPAGLQQGKKILYSALVGLLITIGAFLIVNTFFWALSLGSGPSYLDALWPTVQCNL